MPLTLNEIQSLIGALGLKVPVEIITERKRAEEIAARREKVVAARANKPADWRFNADFDTLLKRSSAAGDQKQFDPAIKLLEEAEQLLQRPDAPPAPPALPIWRDARDAVDDQLRQLYDKLKKAGIPVLDQAANQIENVLGGYRTKLVIALNEYDNAAGEAKIKARSSALQVVTAWQASIPNDTHVIAADTNPFGVKVTIRETLGTALTGLHKQLTSI